MWERINFFEKEGSRQFVLERLNTLSVKILRLKLPPWVVSRTAQDIPTHHRRIPGRHGIQSRNVSVPSFAFHYSL